MMIQPTEREVELYDLIVNTKDKEKVAEYRAELKKFILNAKRTLS